jgi:hypothetical protein
VTRTTVAGARNASIFLRGARRGVMKWDAYTFRPAGRPICLAWWEVQSSGLDIGQLAQQ